MYRKIAIVTISLCLAIVAQTPSWAGQVLEKIKQTGVITAGVRKNAIPFGYVDKDGKWVGFSLDVLELIRKETEKRLGRSIQLKLVQVTPDDRFKKLQDGTIDIECGTSTITWEREKIVDFSVSYFLSGTQLLSKKGSNIGTVDSLLGKKIGVIAKTTNEQILKTLQPKIQLVNIQNAQEGWEKLNKGEIEGLAGDAIVLEGLRISSNKSTEYELFPEFPYQIESYACSLPQDESQWRDLVNYTLVQYMEGVITDNEQFSNLYERWFGVKGVSPYPIETIMEYYQGIINGFEWISLPERY